ncbi:hypothetical protein EJB05_19720, partial [Eragrostis curvula]
MPFEIHLPVIPIGDGCGCAGWTKKIPFSPSAVSSVIDIDSRLDQPGRLIERMGEEQEDKAGELSYCGAGRSRRVELRPEAGEGGRSAWCAAAACGKGGEGEAGVRRSTEEGACRAARRAAREGGSAAVKRGREWARSAAEARCKGEEGDGHGARTPRRSGGGGGRSVRGESVRTLHYTQSWKLRILRRLSALPWVAELSYISGFRRRVNPIPAAAPPQGSGRQSKLRNKHFAWVQQRRLVHSQADLKSTRSRRLPPGLLLRLLQRRSGQGPVSSRKSEQGEPISRMVDEGKTDGWDEVLEEADELPCVQKDPLGARFLSSGAGRRSKSEKKPTFSLRGYSFAPLDMKTENLRIGEQEGTSGLPTTRVSETMEPERLENIEEETEHLPPDFAFPAHRANTSVSELLEDLQGRCGASVRTPALLHLHTMGTAIREQEVSSGVPPTKASQPVIAELLGNTNENTEDLPLEFALSTKKANISVAELLEDLQGRSDSSVRTPASLRQHAPNTAIREQEVSSGVPPTKASETVMTELLGNTKEDIEDLHSEFARPTKKANISVAELLEDLQGRSGSSVGASSSSHWHVRAKDWKPKPPASGKKTLAILGERSLGSEDPLEHVIDGTSSEEEEVIQNYLTPVDKDVKQQTMTDLFQEIFDPTNVESTMLPMRSTGAYCGRMQKIMQMEKDRHAEFLRQYNREPDDSKGIIVQIMSRSLEGKLAVCRCLLQETINFTLTSNASTDQTMDENSTKRTIIFSPKICDNVDLLVGNKIHIFPPWKEVKVQDENVILCTYFSHHGAQ